MASVDFNRIASNIAALNTLNSLRTINNKLSLAQTRLATGKRINEAADDPAGLSIATKLNARSESMKVALNNIGDAKNLLAVAEGGLSKMSDLLITIRSKAEAAASDTMGSTERSAIKNDIQSLAEQIQNIVDETKFNGSKLLDGTVNKQFQTGTDFGEYTSFSLTQAHDPTSLAVSRDTSASGASVTDETLTGDSFTAVGNAVSAFTGLTALDTGSYTAEVKGVASTALIGTATTLSAIPTNVTSITTAQSTATTDEISYDATLGASSGGLFKLVVDSYTPSTGVPADGTISYSVKDNAGSTLWSVVNQTVVRNTTAVDIQRVAGGSTGVVLNLTNTDNPVAGSSIDFEYIGRNRAKVQVTDGSGSLVTLDKDGSSLTTGSGTTGTSGYYTVAATMNTGRGVQLTLDVLANQAAGEKVGFAYSESGRYIVDVGTALSASTYMQTIDTVIDTVNRSIASLGALTARMAAKEDTLSTAQVNTESAYNRIMNADMAAEQVNATKFGILQQTNLAMLAQVNTGPQAILSLFR